MWMRVQQGQARQSVRQAQGQAGAADDEAEEAHEAMMLKAFSGFPHAQDRDQVSIAFDSPVPDFSGIDFASKAHAFYNAEGLRLVGVLFDHLPGALLDALFGHLCLRMATLLRVTYHTAGASSRPEPDRAVDQAATLADSAAHEIAQGLRLLFEATLYDEGDLSHPRLLAEGADRLRTGIRRALVLLRAGR